jgi:hypothetical protein
MSAPKCSHCGVSMWPYETVQKADGPYTRWECKTQRCTTCKGRCTEKLGQPGKP